MLKFNIEKIFLIFVFFLVRKTKEYILSYIFSRVTRITTNIINYVLVKTYNYYVVHIYLSEWDIIILSIYVWHKNLANYIKNKLYNVFISYTFNRNIYPFVRYLEPFYFSAFLITLYHNTLSIYFLFLIFTLSIVTVYYILFFNLNVKKQYPILYYSLIIASTISILACIYIFSILLINDILNITISLVKYICNAINHLCSIYRMNNDYPQGPNGGEPSGGGPNSGGPYNGGPGPEGPVAGAAGIHESNNEEAKERRKRLHNEACRRYRKTAKGKISAKKRREEHSDTLNATNRKYHNSVKGIENQTIWRIDNPDRVKAISDRYTHSDKGKETARNYRKNNKEYIKDTWDNWASENKEKLREDHAKYHEENKERRNERSRKYNQEHKTSVEDSILKEFTSFRGK